MPRRNGNKAFKTRRNKGAHQRRRTTRGHRFISKLKKYHWYDVVRKEGEECGQRAKQTDNRR